MNIKRLAIPTLSLVLGWTGLAAMVPRASAQDAPRPPYGQDRDDQNRDDWDAPPHEFNEIQRRGFSDGINGARKDVEIHRRPDVNNRDEYRHPLNVPRRLQRDYREAFSRGYQQAMSHLMRGPERGNDDHDRH